MFKNLKKLGIVLFLLIAVTGFSMSSVSAGGEGDTVGEPNTLAIAFMGTYHGHGLWVNGIHYKRNLWNMGYKMTFTTQEYDKDGNKLDRVNSVDFTATSPDFIKKFNPNTAYMILDFDDNWITHIEGIKLVANGSHYGGVCANTLSFGYNFRIVGNHFDTGWYTLR